MPPQSRGGFRKGPPHSFSTPNLVSLNSLTEASYLPSPRASPAPDGEVDPSDHALSSSPSPGNAFLAPPSVVTSSSDDDDSDDAHEESDEVSMPPRNPPVLTPSSSSTSSVTKRPSLIRPATTQLPSRPFYSHASRSQSYLGTPLYHPDAFAPPFYNRPPTPLPPSPSLTSLLRPPFSALPSRPTTPDSSDTEGTGVTQTTGSVEVSGQQNLAASARTVAGPVPRASPKVPTYEYYGFVLYLGSSLAFLMYLLWSYLPTPLLHQLGIYYYPDRWWSLAVPSWLTVSVCYIYVALAAYNTGYLTLKVESIENFVDEKGEVAVIDSDGKIIRRDRTSRFKLGAKPGGPVDGASASRMRGAAVRPALGGRRSSGQMGAKGGGVNKLETGKELDWRQLWNEGTDAVMDVPIGGVCEILYGAGRDDESEEDDEFDADEKTPVGLEPLR